MSASTTNGSTPEQIDPKAVAAECNNAAWGLIEAPELSDAQVAQLVSLAATARLFWRKIGTENQIAHAELLFGWAMARAGSPAAQHSAELALDGLKNGADWERAFAHAAMAAAKAGYDPGAHAAHYATAEQLGATLAEGDAKYFAPAFATVPKP